MHVSTEHRFGTWCYSRGRLVTKWKHCLCILVVHILSSVAIIFIELCLPTVGGQSNIKFNAKVTILLVCIHLSISYKHHQLESLWNLLSWSKRFWQSKGGMPLIILVNRCRRTKAISFHGYNASRSHKQRHLRQGIISVYDVTSSKHLTTKPWYVAATNGL